MLDLLLFRLILCFQSFLLCLFVWFGWSVDSRSHMMVWFHLCWWLLWKKVSFDCCRLVLFGFHFLVILDACISYKLMPKGKLIFRLKDYYNGVKLRVGNPLIFVFPNFIVLNYSQNLDFCHSVATEWGSDCIHSNSICVHFSSLWRFRRLVCLYNDFLQCEP